MTEKTPEQKKFEEFYLPADFYIEGEDEGESPCNYGADTECVKPALRNMGNCFECWLYQEMIAEDICEGEG